MFFGMDGVWKERSLFCAIFFFGFHDVLIFYAAAGSEPTCPACSLHPCEVSFIATPQSANDFACMIFLMAGWRVSYLTFRFRSRLLRLAAAIGTAAIGGFTHFQTDVDIETCTNTSTSWSTQRTDSTRVPQLKKAACSGRCPPYVRRSKTSWISTIVGGYLLLHNRRNRRPHHNTYR